MDLLESMPSFRVASCDDPDIESISDWPVAPYAPYLKPPVK
jgi:hypothetical protein